MSAISVIICSHKAPLSLLKCLRSLADQTDKGGLEVILVNNGFSAEAETFLFDEISRWNAGFAFRICHESRSGLGYARIRGFEEASGEWLVLLDDDNTVEPDFIHQLRSLVQAHSGVGGITSAVAPVWEQTPPKWLQDFGILCLSYNCPELPAGSPREIRYEPDQFLQAPRPPGGGMIVSGKVIDAYLTLAKNSAPRVALERSGDSLVGCGDQDIWNQIGRLGMTVLESDRLQVLHHIPASRIKLPYLLRLNFLMQYSYRLLDRLTTERPKPRAGGAAIFRVVAQTARLLKIALLFPGENPWQKQLLLIACEWGRFAGDRAELTNYGG